MDFDSVNSEISEQTKRNYDIQKTRRDVGRGDEFVLVLLKHQGVFRETFYLNLRPKEDDDVYSHKIGLFGGKIDKDDKGQHLESEKAAAEREMKEETGLSVGQDFYHLADITGFNSAKKETDGRIFLKVMRKTQTNSIKKYLRAENPRLVSIDRKPVGELVVIRRYFGKLSLFWRWWRLTPQAAYALRDVFERDPTK